MLVKDKNFVLSNVSPIFQILVVINSYKNCGMMTKKKVSSLVLFIYFKRMLVMLQNVSSLVDCKLIYHIQKSTENGRNFFCRMCDHFALGNTNNRLTY